MAIGAPALAAATHLGADSELAARALETMEPAFGRGQVIPYRERPVTVLLVKNPAGFNQVIRVLRKQAPMPVLVAINDLDADGRDVSWLWDARVEDLAATGHRFGASGIRSHDMALRFKYAGMDAWSDPDLAGALDRVVGEAPVGSPVAGRARLPGRLATLDHHPAGAIGQHVAGGRAEQALVARGVLGADVDQVRVALDRLLDDRLAGTSKRATPPCGPQRPRPRRTTGRPTRRTPPPPAPSWRQRLFGWIGPK